MGANPFPPPKYLLKLLEHCTDNKEYTSPSGSDSLKQTLIHKYSNANYQVTDTIIGNGLKELLYILLKYFSLEYKLYLISPFWVSYLEQAEITNINYELINTYNVNNYKITPHALDIALSNTDKKKLLILNNPTNPTGAIYYKNELEELSKIMKLHNVIVISDEIYMNLVYSKNKHLTTSITRYYNRVIIGSSLSKEFTTGGWRLGWLTFNKELEDIYKNIYILASSIYTCASTPLQLVATKALQYPTELVNYIEYMTDFFSKLGDYCYSRFYDMDLITSKPFAAWYIFLDFSNYKKKLNRIGVNDCTSLVNKLISSIGFVTVSGKSFGYKYMTLRYSFVDVTDPYLNIPFEKKIMNIKEGLNKLEKWLKRLT